MHTSIHSETGLCLARRCGEERQKPGLHKTYSLFSGQEIVEGIDIRNQVAKTGYNVSLNASVGWNLVIKF